MLQRNTLWSVSIYGHAFAGVALVALGRALERVEPAAPAAQADAQ